MAVQATELPTPPPPSGATSLSFSQGFLLGQFSIVLLIFCFIKFFIFGEPPPADERALNLSSLRRQRTLAHQRSQSNPLRRKASSVLRNPPAPLTTASILAKTYYNVHGHQPESLDWFNVLIAQTIAQLRADARHDNAVLKSLTKVLNGHSKPDWIGEIRVTEIALGDEFPIFSNCRVIPVEEGGLFDGAGSEGGRLQARMDVDLSDVLTLGIETTLVLNYPKPLVAVLPVALAVSVVRFSGTLALSFIPSTPPSPTTTTTSSPPKGSSANPLQPPTSLAFTFLDDYRLDLSVRSLVGSRSRLQDVPKIAQLVEARLHAWFDERVVEPRFQQIALPNLWPRKKNTRGGDEDDDGDETDDRASVTPRKRSSSTVHGPRPRAPSSSASSAFEARMEVEGTKLWEAEERRGIRSRRDQDLRELRYRGHPRHAESEDGSSEWSAGRSMPGSMPGSLIG